MPPTFLFGRTNQRVPALWLRLSMGEASPAELVEAALATGLPIDISTQPALWGGFLIGCPAVLSAVGTHQIERSVNEDHAVDLLQAHLLELLSCIGRERLDYYFLPVRKGLEEFQTNGALIALEGAKDQGHVGFLGLSVEGNPLAALGFWQFHDSFEAVMTSRSISEPIRYETIAPLAKDRRVGLLASVADLAEAPQFAREHPVLVTVRTPSEIAAAVRALGGG